MIFSECREWHFCCIERTQENMLYCIPRHVTPKLCERLAGRKPFKWQHLEEFKCASIADFWSRATRDAEKAETHVWNTRIRLLDRSVIYRWWLFEKDQQEDKEWGTDDMIDRPYEAEDEIFLDKLDDDETEGEDSDEEPSGSSLTLPGPSNTPGSSELATLSLNGRRHYENLRFTLACNRFCDLFNKYCQHKNLPGSVLPVPAQVKGLVLIQKRDEGEQPFKYPPQHTADYPPARHCVLAKLSRLTFNHSHLFAAKDRPSIGLRLGSATLRELNLEDFCLQEPPTLLLLGTSSMLEEGEVYIIPSEILDSSRAEKSEAHHLGPQSNIIAEPFAGINVKRFFRQVNDGSLYRFFETLIARANMAQAYTRSNPDGANLLPPLPLQLQYRTTVRHALLSSLLETEVDEVLDVSRNRFTFQYRVRWKNLGQRSPPWLLLKSLKHRRGFRAAADAFYENLPESKKAEFNYEKPKTLQNIQYANAKASRDFARIVQRRGMEKAARTPH